MHPITHEIALPHEEVSAACWEGWLSISVLAKNRKETMSDVLPRSTVRAMQFENGCANGLSHRWLGGQYCSIMTRNGIVGCGIYDITTPAEFGQAIAIAKGTPENPLVEPEDLLVAVIVDATPKAKEFGIVIGMSGREAVERLLVGEA